MLVLLLIGMVFCGLLVTLLRSDVAPVVVCKLKAPKMPNGYPSPLGESPLHTSDSEERIVVKVKRRVRVRRVSLRWKRFVHQKRQKKIRNRLRLFFLDCECSLPGNVIHIIASCL